jgi:Protein of unknown function (DUF2844)
MKKVFVLLAALAVAASPGWAVLGGSAESVVTDQVKFQARRAVVERGAYTVHEISRDDGTVIREYVSSAGKVFGVSWTGPTIPDLTQLLGSYNTEFQNTLHAQGKPLRRRSAVVHNADLEVENSGHARAFHGRAYLNSLLPSGLPQETVQ